MVVQAVGSSPSNQAIGGASAGAPCGLRLDLGSLNSPPENPSQKIELSNDDFSELLKSLGIEYSLPENFQISATIKIANNQNNPTINATEADNSLKELLRTPSKLAALSPGSEIKLEFKANIEEDLSGNFSSSLLGIPVTPFASIKAGAAAEVELLIRVESDKDLRVSATIGGDIEGSAEAGVRPPWINLPEPLNRAVNGMSHVLGRKAIKCPEMLKRFLDLLKDAPTASAGLETENTKNRSIVFNIPKSELSFKELFSAIFSRKLFSDECLASLNPTKIESGSFSARAGISLSLPGDVNVKIGENGLSRESEQEKTPTEKKRERLWDRVSTFLGGKREVKVKTGTVTQLEGQGGNRPDTQSKTCACVEISLAQHWRREWHSLKAIRFLRSLRPDCELLARSSEEFSLQPSSLKERILGKDRAQQQINIVFSPEEVSTILSNATSNSDPNLMKQSYLTAAKTIRDETNLPPHILKIAESFAENLSLIANKTNVSTNCREPLENLFLNLSKDACLFTAILALKELASESNTPNQNPSLISGQISAPGLSISIGNPASTS
jgi:hypothetical protein